MFRDRTDAAEQLAENLKQYEHKDCVVLAIPRGAVPMAYLIAVKLHLPLDVIFTKKIGHPVNKEYAIGAVSLNSAIVSEHNEDVSDEYITKEIPKLRSVLEEKYKMYSGGSTPLSLKDKTVILVDDGIATGSTMMASIEMLRKQEVSEIVVAIPVAPKTSLEKIRKMADEVICLSTPSNFFAVGQFYEEFGQVSDEEAMKYLKKAKEIYVGQ